MLGQEPGAGPGSDLYFQTPSENARRLLYYMTSCGYYYTDYSYHIERGDYHSYLVFYLVSGRLSLSCNGQTMVAEAGQAGILNCHVPHEYHTIGNAEFVWLHLDGVNTAQLYESIVQQHGGFVFSSPNAEELKKDIYNLVYACRNSKLPGEVRLSRALYGILSALLDSEQAADAQDTDSPIVSAMLFINQHYSLPLTLEDVAQHVSMSQFHFSRQFKKECGYSPHEYIIITRLNAAQHLLKTTELPIKTIAQEVGYQSVTTFTNAFTGRIGLSPSQFRKYPI